MGVTAFSITLIEKVNYTSVIELGAQNLYDKDYGHPVYASAYYKGDYACIDLNGENNALKLNLNEPLPLNFKTKYDLVTDFGTSEHTDNLHQCWKTKHHLCKVGGHIISENPKTGNWKEHGHFYYTQEFYKELAQAMNYTIVELGEYPAMGNTTDGWNVYCILKKNDDNKFLTKITFNELPFCKS
jgi:hypothetical protein